MQEKKRFKNPPFDPVTIGELAARGLALSIHCRACGHFSFASASALPIKPQRAVPSLDGAFKCGSCGSRNSCAMPVYPRPAPGG